MQIEIIKCHGSGNEFVMVDLVAQPAPEDLAEFARQVCAHSEVGGSDGILYVVRYGEGYAMRMFNPDGSEAEMCGNGIRCVARLVQQRYLQQQHFTLYSGGQAYPTSVAEPIDGCIAAFGVDIEVRLQSPDFAFAANKESHIASSIPSLGEEPFTALNLGNPHIVAAVQQIDMERLEELGEKVKREKGDFPKGINVSLYSKMGDNAIFVATYERGAGITYSCGTAMTASATASTLLGICQKEQDIEVYNRGGMVRCLSRTVDGRIITRLTGNATYCWQGVAHIQNGQVTICKQHHFHDEVKAWDSFTAKIAK